MARYTFLNAAARDLYGEDWTETARETWASCTCGQPPPPGPQLVQLVGELSVGNQDFRRWWADQDVFPAPVRLQELRGRTRCY